MILGAIGVNATSQLLQSLRSNQTSNDGSTSDFSTPSTQTDQTPSSTQDGGSISDASQKVIADLKSLLLSLQSSDGTATAATPDAAASTTAASTTAPSATDADSTTQSDLKTLFSDLKKAGGHHHGHHGGPPPGPPPGTPPDGTTASTTTSSTAGTSETGQTQSLDGVADALVKALKAYAAAADGSTQSQASTLSA